MKFLDNFLMPMQKAVKQSVSSFIRLETSDNETTLVSSDGSMISYLRVEGCKQLIGDEEFEKIVNASAITVGARFDRSGHAMQVYFARDPGRIRSKLEQQVKPSRTAARNIGLDLEDLMDERVNHLEKFLSYEECYFVLWTRPSALPAGTNISARRTSKTTFISS